MYAVIIAETKNPVGHGRVLSTHNTESAAAAALPKVPGAYVAHRKPDGEWETRLEAQERQARAYY